MSLVCLVVLKVWDQWFSERGLLFAGCRPNGSDVVDFAPVLELGAIVC